MKCVSVPFQGVTNLSHYSQNSSYFPQFQPNRLTNNSLGPAGIPLGVPLGHSQYPIQNQSGIPFNNQSHFNNQSAHHDSP